METKELIARRAAMELQDGNVVNLGIGLPTLIPNFLPSGVNIILQSENGYIGLGPVQDEIIPDLVNAGGKPASIVPGGAFFDSATSFALIRGGHVDVTILGGLEVDGQGNLANWMVPGKMVPGMGGAMDLVTGAKKVIVAMEHRAKNGSSKIVSQCSLPLTARGVVSLIITELAVFKVTDGGLVLEELAPDVDLETVTSHTAAPFIVSPNLTTMKNIVSDEVLL
ncbi:3-oxoacid CoA-transferase subunit B [Paenibacillus sp. BR2-3]|uniref:3-oxoacid CoA-transferase subunit B n=1 Tax=Paenibacillus sp. BR2-3 TaxID=3048494 RepID=UPI00397797F6